MAKLFFGNDKVCFGVEADGDPSAPRPPRATSGFWRLDRHAGRDGYAGILAGPAAVGFVAQAVGLTASFWLLAALMCLVPPLAKPAAQ